MKWITSLILGFGLLLGTGSLFAQTPAGQEPGPMSAQTASLAPPRLTYQETGGTPGRKRRTLTELGKPLVRPVRLEQV